MKNITISLIAEKIVFSGEFPRQQITLKEWTFKSGSVNREDIKLLYHESISPQFGWSSYDIHISPEKIRVEFIPTIFVDSLKEKITNSEEKLLKEIEKDIDKFVLVQSNTDSKLQLSIAKPKKLKELQAFYLHSHGESENAELEKFIKKLSVSDIDYHIEYEHSNAIEQGASDGWYEAIVFISESIVSGGLYDYLKVLPLVAIEKVNKDRLDKIKTVAAHHLGTQPENIELIKLEKNEDYIAAIFYFNRVKYKFEFNSRNEIITFEKGV